MNGIIMLHFMWVFTVCKSTHLGVSRIQRVNLQKEPLSIRDGRKLDKPSSHACLINQEFGYMKQTILQFSRHKISCIFLTKMLGGIQIPFPTEKEPPPTKCWKMFQNSIYRISIFHYSMHWSLVRGMLKGLFCILASAWDFQQCCMCDQQSLRSACAYRQSDQSLC